MNLPKLRHALRDLSGHLEKRVRDDGDLITLHKDDVRDVAALIAALTHVLEGKTIGRAFGEPADWGYRTGIGPALVSEPDPVRHDRKDGQRVCTCWFCLNTGPNGECENCGLPPSPERLAGKK